MLGELRRTLDLLQERVAPSPCLRGRPRGRPGREDTGAMRRRGGAPSGLASRPQGPLSQGPRLHLQGHSLPQSQPQPQPQPRGRSWGRDIDPLGCCVCSQNQLWRHVLCVAHCAVLNVQSRSSCSAALLVPGERRDGSEILRTSRQLVLQSFRAQSAPSLAPQSWQVPLS